MYDSKRGRWHSALICNGVDHSSNRAIHLKMTPLCLFVFLWSRLFLAKFRDKDPLIVLMEDQDEVVIDFCQSPPLLHSSLYLVFPFVYVSIASNAVPCTLIRKWKLFFNAMSSVARVCVCVLVCLCVRGMYGLLYFWLLIFMPWSAVLFLRWHLWQQVFWKQW